MSQPLSDVREELAYTSCEISDALLKLGVEGGGYLPEIVMMSPSPFLQAVGATTGPVGSDASAKLRLSGPAFTIQIVDAVREKDSPRIQGHHVDMVEEGSVVVVNAPEHLRNAVWGGLMSAGAKARGARGVVVSGRVRDLEEQQAMGFKVFAKGRSTLGSRPFARASAVQLPVTISAPSLPSDSGYSWPSVTIHPGDWIVGDVDGVVVVPQALVKEVAQVAAAGRATDAKCLEDIERGLGVAAAFARHR